MQQQVRNSRTIKTDDDGITTKIATESKTMTHDDIVEVIHDTIAGLEATCRITLYDIYGSMNGFQITEFKVQAEENAEYAKPARMSDYRHGCD